MGMGFAPTWLRQVSPPPLLHKTTLTIGDTVLQVRLGTWRSKMGQRFLLVALFLYTLFLCILCVFMFLCAFMCYPYSCLLPGLCLWALLPELKLPK